MAAPSEVTITNLNGRYKMNNALSDKFDPILALQGLNWLTRKALGLATVTLSARQYTPSASPAPSSSSSSSSTSDSDAPSPPPMHLDIQQFMTGGLEVAPEKYILDWRAQSKEDVLFGPVTGRSRLVRFGDGGVGEGEEGWEDAAYLDGGWEDGEGGLRLQSCSWSEKDGWRVNQTWGFEDVDGLRRHTRRCVVTKGEEKLHARFVYDYLGPL